MNVMHFLAKALQPSLGHRLFTSDQFPLDDEQIADTAIKAMLLVMNNGGRAAAWNRKMGIAVEDYAALLLHGVCFPWKERLALSSEVDLLNDELPSMATVGLTRSERGVFAQALFITTPSTNEWKQFSTLRGAIKVYRAGWVRGYDRLSRSMVEKHGSSDQIESVLDVSYAAVMPDGVCVGCDWRGVPDFHAANLTAYVVGMHNDRRFFWDVCATEEFWDGYPAKAHFAIDEEYVKSLFYARSLPMTMKGRLRPILHWVQAHKRRIKEGIDIDVRKHLRGADRFSMHGVNFHIEQPRKIAKSVDTSASA